MASVQYLVEIAEHFVNEILVRRGSYLQLEQDRHFAALLIQKTYRGYKVRKMIKMWNDAATVIQKYVRGWLVRWHMPEILEKYLQMIRWLFYNKAATKIQAVWRGYSVRKKFNIKDQINERKKVQETNERTQTMLKEAFEELRKQNRFDDNNEKKQKTIRALENMHHLLRTKQHEGVFSLHGSNKLSDIEKIIIYLTKRKLLMKNIMVDAATETKSNVSTNTLLCDVIFTTTDITR